MGFYEHGDKPFDSQIWLWTAAGSLCTMVR